MTPQKPALFVLLILTLLLTSGLATAQEQSGYDIALERIEEARVSGATELDLGRLGLETLPPELFEVIEVRSLYLAYNHLSDLPPEIGQLTNLTTLYMNSNRLSSLPAEIGLLEGLTWITVERNQLTSLPPEIGQLANLTFLSVVNNQLTSLPSEITQLSKLCDLNLFDNAFHHLPAELADLPSMASAGCSLNVRGNPLITPPEDVVAQGTPAILDYLRNQAAMQAQQITLAIAGMVGLVAAFLLAFRWKTQRSGRKKKRVA